MWVDAYSLVALIKFILGKPVDLGVLFGVLGFYTTHQIATKVWMKPPQGPSEGALHE